MHDSEKPGQAPDPVEEAGGESFPASDPPAWTATRTGKPEAPAGKKARRAAAPSPPPHCEVVGLFRSDREAEPAADALLASGFNRVDIGPPRRRGRAAPADAMARTGQRRAAAPGSPPNAVLLRVSLESSGDRQRALAILEAQGARDVRVDWRKDC